MPLSAVLMQDHIYQGLCSGSGAFANGQTFQCHPAAAMAGLAVLKVFEEDHVVENCRQRGEEVRTLLVKIVMSCFISALPSSTTV
jgi:adenosylmethionine-8-amino-7-oxononanoate aminotransferase